MFVVISVQKGLTTCEQCHDVTYCMGFLLWCRYFLNSKCAWYAKTFEGTFEISLTCLVVFSVLVSTLPRCT